MPFDDTTYYGPPEAQSSGIDWSGFLTGVVDNIFGLADTIISSNNRDSVNDSTVRTDTSSSSSNSGLTNYIPYILIGLLILLIFAMIMKNKR